MIRRVLDSLKVLLGRRRFEREMDAELTAHLELQTEDLIRRGIPGPEARRRARAAFGAVLGVKDAARAARGVRWADELRGDLRYAVRTLRKSPGYAAVAVLTLALGLGANTAMFSVVDGVLLKPLPFPESGRLVRLNFGYPVGVLWTYRSATSSYTGVAAYAYGGELNLFDRGNAERLKGRPVSAEFFSVLGVAALLGRTFRAGEDSPGAPAVAVISEGLWRRRFRADSGIVGRAILIDGSPREVVGVVPRSFTFPTAGTDLWIPIRLDPKLIPSVWGADGGTFIGRLKPGVTLAKADAEHRALIPRIRDAFPYKMPDNYGQNPGNHVRMLDDAIGRPVRGRLSLLLAAVALVLLVACVNVANLNLTRLATREREIAVRQALGGSRLRVARQLVVEQLVVAAVGGLLGVALAVIATPALVGSLPPETPRLDQVVVDLRVLLFSGLGIVVAALLTSLGPLVRLPHTGPAEALVAGARGGGGGSSAGPRRARLTALLVGTEVALSVVLAIGALILLRSLGRLLAVDPGVAVERLVTARVTPNPIWCKDQAGPCTCLPDGGRCLGFFPALEERLAALPGVSGVGMSTSVPLDGASFSFPMDIEDHPVPPGQPAHMLMTHTISPGYFSAMGIPLLAGRGFSAADRTGTPRVVIVSRAMANRYWPGVSPVGKHIKPVWIPDFAEIVGVVGDARYEGLATEQPSEDFYMPMAQWGVGSLKVALRTPLATGQVESLLRKEVAAVDPSATVIQVRSMGDVVLASAAAPRTTTTLIGLFAAIALALGAIGVYGVLSYGVTRRRREIGIRMAIGAAPRAVQAMVLREAARLLAGGVAAGLLIAWLGASVLKGFVFGVSVRDPLSYLAVPALFAAVGVAAAYLPARRATRVSPTEVMREE
jgi:predicted permease